MRRRLRKRPSRRPVPGLALLGIGAASAAGFALLARSVARRETDGVDAAARRKAPRPRGPRVKKLAELTGPLGKPWLLGPASAALAAYTRPSSRAAATAIGLSSAASTALCRVFDRTLPHRPAPPGKREDRDEPSFPSGHALQTTAVALTTAYVLSREGKANAWIAAPAAAVLPLVSAGGRVTLDRHWASDVAGGLLAGLTVAACCAAAYEMLPD
jgi:undecaprenyl-diphosphatase